MVLFAQLCLEDPASLVHRILSDCPPSGLLGHSAMGLVRVVFLECNACSFQGQWERLNNLMAIFSGAQGEGREALVGGKQMGLAQVVEMLEQFSASNVQ